MLDHLHSGLSGFLRRKNFVPKQERVDGAIPLSIDNRYRIYCRPAAHGDLVLEARLIDLPMQASDVDALIRECLLASWVRMHEHADVPVLSENETSIFLEQRISADASIDEFEAALEKFTNSIADWRRIFRIL